MSLLTATYLLAAIFAAGGLFSLSAALFGWEWFFNSANVKLLTGKMSRSVARVLYALIGVAILAMALYLCHTANSPLR
ncbi:MAG: hypothetical protein HDS29_02180 [Bacteroides sp.]|nr:hypothetical protein [Bacteroides sp.]